jgi:hypothetical protein
MACPALRPQHTEAARPQDVIPRPPDAGARPLPAHTQHGAHFRPPPASLRAHRRLLDRIRPQIRSCGALVGIRDRLILGAERRMVVPQPIIARCPLVRNALPADSAVAGVRGRSVLARRLAGQTPAFEARVCT